MVLRARIDTSRRILFVHPMRSYPGLVLALCVFSAQAADKRLDDLHFAESAKQGKVTVKQMLSCLRAELPDLTKEVDKCPLYFAEIYAAATKSASLAEREELEKVMKAIPV